MTLQIKVMSWNRHKNVAGLFTHVYRHLNCSMFISFLNYLPFQRTWLFTHVYTHLNCSMFISFLIYLPFQRTWLFTHVYTYLNCSMFISFLNYLPFQRTWLFTHVYTHLNCSMFISFLNYLPFQRTSVHMFNVHFLFELFTLPENLSSRHCFCRVDVAQLLIFCIVLKGRCLSLWLLFNLSIACPSSFHHI